ncbi:MAG: flagellar assembly protein FliH [Pseudomonadota bacterium]
MTSFGDERPSVVAARKPPPEEVVVQEEAAPPPPDYPTEQELAAISEQARLEGYQDGLAAGRAEALALGQAATAEELAQVRAIALAFGHALAEADQLIANDVLELALHLSKGMLKAALPVRPELILPIVREAIEYLPVLQQPALLMLHPDDIKTVRDGIGDELEKGGWRVVEDASVGRGGCRVDTASNQIDAQAASRWQRLSSALGKDLDWLAP